MKQSKLRRRRVIRYAIFIGLIAGPVVAGKQLKPDVLRNLGNSMPLKDQFRLMQPNGQNNKNTNGTAATGTGRDGYTGALTRTSTDGATGGGKATATGGAKIKLF